MRLKKRPSLSDNWKNSHLISLWVEKCFSSNKRFRISKISSYSIILTISTTCAGIGRNWKKEALIPRLNIIKQSKGSLFLLVIDFIQIIISFEMHYHPKTEHTFRIIIQISRFLKEFSDFETIHTPKFRHP